MPVGGKREDAVGSLPSNDRRHAPALCEPGDLGRCLVQIKRRPGRVGQIGEMLYAAADIGSSTIDDRTVLYKRESFGRDRNEDAARGIEAQESGRGSP